MPRTHFDIEQATFGREGGRDANLWARSPGFRDDWLPEACELIVRFGIRPVGVACPQAVFALPFDVGRVAVVQVADQPGGVLGFHFLVIERRDYERYLGDPFQVAYALPADWGRRGELSMQSWPRTPLPRRTVAQVCDVLRRVKVAALPENVDPETYEPERTAENSESPALLGGAQVLVDGGRLMFARPAPDPALLAGLWLLLPNSTRCRLWPASFAFSNDLGFDALVVPEAMDVHLEGYTSEEQAMHYPEGYFELTLQVAAEGGDQRRLDALLERRSGAETIRLGLILLVLMMVLALTPRVIEVMFPKAPRPDGLTPERSGARAVTGIVGSAHPWSAVGFVLWERLQHE